MTLICKKRAIEEELPLFYIIILYVCLSMKFMQDRAISKFFFPLNHTFHHQYDVIYSFRQL